MTSPWPLDGAAGTGDAEKNAAIRPLEVMGTARDWSTRNARCWDAELGAAT